MFISKKEYDALIERVNRLESKVNTLERKSTTASTHFGTDVDLGRLCHMLPSFVDRRAAAEFDRLFNDHVKKAATLFLDIQ